MPNPLHGHNPDVLTCLANLSNDEVFTPPGIANAMLDMLPQDLFSNPDTTFLDPAAKSGVFLREIAKRLIRGLAPVYPNLQERLNHIFRHQLFGISITELTSHLSRRSLYCSKDATGQYSVVSFTEMQGNIHYASIPHRWENGKCKFCGASQQQYGEESRGEGLENHAYEFIHTEPPENIFDMQFDVIIGNPPYQLDTGGAGRQAKPIYNLFVEQAMKLNPRFLSMIIPSRWFAGGMGLDNFRDMMMKNGHITKMVDYANAKDCFPQNSISGGVCYFLWERDRKAACEFTNISGDIQNTLLRSLNEFPVLVRYNDAVSILRKACEREETPLAEISSSLSPFGLPTNFRGRATQRGNYTISVHTSAGVSYAREDEIPGGADLLGSYKVLISKTSAEHAGEPDKTGAFRVLTSATKVIGPNEACTHSYFVVGNFDNVLQAENLLSYLRTKFARLLILMALSSINLSRNVFCFIPVQDFSRTWTDGELYEKYGLSETEIAFVESIIKPMA